VGAETVKHKNCGGRFIAYTIREHGYCFMRCEKCGHHYGGKGIEAKVKRLMGTKVSPTLRRL
jgi:PHP family Zn ribbon phosphoesterase